jgi:hypothetical protein
MAAEGMANITGKRIRIFLHADLLEDIGNFPNRILATKTKLKG